MSEELPEGQPANNPAPAQPPPNATDDSALAEGKFDAALAEMQQETVDGGRDLGLALVYYAMRRTADANAAFARLIKERASDRAYQIAEVHAYRMEINEAFAWLDRAYN